VAASASRTRSPCSRVMGSPGTGIRTRQHDAPPARSPTHARPVAGRATGPSPTCSRHGPGPGPGPAHASVEIHIQSVLPARRVEQTTDQFRRMFIPGRRDRGRLTSQAHALRHERETRAARHQDVGARARRAVWWVLRSQAVALAPSGVSRTRSGLRADKPVTTVRNGSRHHGCMRGIARLGPARTGQDLKSHRALPKTSLRTQRAASRRVGRRE